MSDHALISPSGFFRIELCRGSLAMEDGEPNESSFYAAEGTAAHDLAQRVLYDRACDTGTKPWRDAADYIDEEITADGRTFTVTEEMAEAVQTYVDKIMSRDLSDAEVLVEQRLYHGPYLGLPREDAFGTGDCVILDFKSSTIWVDDFKYGKGVRVYAEENSQMKCYALGALQKFGLVHDFQHVVMAIHQPRIDHYDAWECTVEELERWAREEGAIIASNALKLLNDKIHGGTDYMLPENLNPGEKQCKFCNAAHKCPALAVEVAEVTGAADDDDFADETHIALKSNERLALGMDKVDLVEVWCKAQRAEIERRLLSGQDVPGYELVVGKLGNRAWTDKAAAEAKLKELKLPHEDLYVAKLAGFPALEKVVKKANPAAWEELQEFVSRAPGRPSVAKMGSGREKAESHTATEDDFEDLSHVVTHPHPFRS